MITIGIGWAVGRTIQRITHGLGGTRHQVPAVALTYAASCVGYFPAIVGAVSDSGEHAISVDDLEGAAAAAVDAAEALTLEGDHLAVGSASKRVPGDQGILAPLVPLSQSHIHDPERLLE